MFEEGRSRGKGISVNRNSICKGSEKKSLACLQTCKSFSMSGARSGENQTGEVSGKESKEAGLSFAPNGKPLKGVREGGNR